jgi:hypothetical protein
LVLSVVQLLCVDYVWHVLYLVDLVQAVNPNISAFLSVWVQFRLPGLYLLTSAGVVLAL